MERLSPEQRAVFLLREAFDYPYAEIAAAREGDLEPLVALLAEDVVLHGDGGGRVPAVTRPGQGRERVARTLPARARPLLRSGTASMIESRVNGQPGAIARDPSGRLINAIALDYSCDRITAIYSIVDLDQLRHLGPVENLAELFRSRIR